MGVQAYRYRFNGEADLKAARDTLTLALLAAGGLFGRCRVRMDSGYAVDETINVIAVDAGTVVGMTVCLILTAFLTAELGPDGFDVRPVESIREGQGHLPAGRQVRL